VKRLVTAGILLLFVLAGCGSSSKSSSSTASAAPASSSSSTTSTPAPAPASGSGSALTLAADPGGALKYNKKTLSAKAGKVSIDFTNNSPVGHNVTIATSGGSVVGATPTFQGGSKTLSVSLKPGKYVFYCSVPGHRMAGMQGTLVVK
jgi:plastocyanin